jgi:hypothetical protein
VSGGGGQYFHVGDIVRRNGKPMEVTVVSARYVLVVRPRWWRRAWSYVRRMER